MKRLLHFLRTGHWPTRVLGTRSWRHPFGVRPKRFRYPFGIPRVEEPPKWRFIGYTHEGYEDYARRVSVWDIEPFNYPLRWASESHIIRSEN